MVTLTELPNGALRLSIDKENKYSDDDLAELIDRHGGDDLNFLQDALEIARYFGNDWWVVSADELGNLSEAPCIYRDAMCEDPRFPMTFGRIWYFATYQTESVAETLRDKGEVIFQPLHRVPVA